MWRNTSQALSAGLYRVSFAGDGFTPVNVATDMALLRSADLTLQQGYSHFAVIGGSDQVQVNHGVTPSTTSVSGYQKLGNTLYATTTTRPGVAYTTSMPTATSTVAMYRERPAASAVLVYDARDIYEELTRKYGVKVPR